MGDESCLEMRNKEVFTKNIHTCETLNIKPFSRTARSKYIMHFGRKSPASEQYTNVRNQVCVQH